MIRRFYNEKGDFIMRAGCWECCEKHLASAAIANIEIDLGYPEFRIYVIGNLDHASQEIVEFHPDLASLIREHRVAWTNSSKHNIPYEDIGKYIRVCALLADDDHTLIEKYPKISEDLWPKP